MTDDKHGSTGDRLNEAMDSLREEYAQAAVDLAEQPEPKTGREIRSRRFPRIVSYGMGILAVAMLATAIFLFNAQAQSETAVTEIPSETAVVTDSDNLLPTPPFMEAPPLPDDAIPPPPEPTPWPTPPIELESPPEDGADSG